MIRTVGVVASARKTIVLIMVSARFRIACSLRSMLAVFRARREKRWVFLFRRATVVFLAVLRTPATRFAPTRAAGAFPRVAACLATVPALRLQKRRLPPFVNHTAIRLNYKIDVARILAARKRDQQLIGS